MAGKQSQSCGTCGGSGKITVTITGGEDQGKSETVTCPSCNGTGSK